MQPRNILTRHIRSALLAQDRQDDLLEKATIFVGRACFALCFRVLGEEPRRQFGDGGGRLRRYLCARGIGPFCDIGEHSQRLRARGLGCPRCAMPTDGVPSLLSRAGPIFEDVANRIAALASGGKAGQPTIPHDLAPPQCPNFPQPYPPAFAHRLATILATTSADILEVARNSRNGKITCFQDVNYVAKWRARLGKGATSN